MPRIARVAQGGTAFFCVRSLPIGPADSAEAPTKWLWEGPLGQTASTPYFRVTTAGATLGAHVVTLTSLDTHGVKRRFRARLRVLPPEPHHALKRTHLIKKIVLERTQVHSGEYFAVRIETQPSPTASPIHVNIHGRWANPRILQIKGPPGKRQLHVTAVAPGAYDAVTVEVEVVAGAPAQPPVDFYVRPDVSRPMTATFKIGGPATLHTYQWDFGDGQQATTTTGEVSHDYTNYVGIGQPYAVAQVTVTSPGAGVTGRKTVTIWSPEAAALNRTTTIQPDTPIPDPINGLDLAAAERTALVLSGGGAKGAFQVGVVSYLYETFGLRPQIITGTSVGALNAAKLAEGGDDPPAGVRLEELWRTIRGDADIYQDSDELNALQDEFGDLPGEADDVFDYLEIVGRVLVGPIAYLDLLLDLGDLSVLSRLTNLYDQDGLQRMVDEHLDPDLVAASGVLLRLASVDLVNGRLRYFTETGAILNRSFSEVAPAGTVGLRTAVLASSAIPAAFKRVRIQGRDYIDGAVREDVPLRAALELNPSHIVVVTTSPSAFEPGGLVPLGEIPEDYHPRALDIFVQAVEIMGDEVARDDIQAQRAMNWTLREVFAERDPDAPPLELTVPPGPESPPVAGRRLLTYPLGHLTRHDPFRIDYVVPSIMVIEPPWVVGTTTDFDPWVIASCIELGKKVAELRTTEIPGGLSLEDAICEFVLARAEECAGEFGPISNACWTWSDWAYNHCGGPDRIGRALEALRVAWAHA